MLRIRIESVINCLLDPRLGTLLNNSSHRVPSNTYELLAAEADELLAIQSVVRIGAGLGVLMVAVDTSPMILSASLQAWYMRNISSRFSASSADSSIIELWTPEQEIIQIKKQLR